MIGRPSLAGICLYEVAVEYQFGNDVVLLVGAGIQKVLRSKANKFLNKFGVQSMQPMDAISLASV